MLDGVKNSLYYNFVASREDFKNYYLKWQDKKIEKENAKKEIGSLGTNLDKFFSNPMTQDCMKKQNPFAFSLLNDHPTYEKNFTYRSVNLFRNCMRSLSGIFPGLKTY